MARGARRADRREGSRGGRRGRAVPLSAPSPAQSAEGVPSAPHPAAPKPLPRPAPPVARGRLRAAPRGAGLPPVTARPPCRRRPSLRGLAGRAACSLPARARVSPMAGAPPARRPRPRAARQAPRPQGPVSAGRARAPVPGTEHCGCGAGPARGSRRARGRERRAPRPARPRPPARPGAMQSLISPVTKAILVALFIFAILLILYVILWYICRDVDCDHGI
ncbi:uncharacterized protein LOC141569621 [Rhinolophus sinicus]|uniref:uncharacterized protein LOC141569621 n=1 Tax=Rhinolophus sinicus TaxID=89399 RepID=UPI003D7A6C46